MEVLYNLNLGTVVRSLLVTKIKIKNGEETTNLSQRQNLLFLLQSVPIPLNIGVFNALPDRVHPRVQVISFVLLNNVTVRKSQSISNLNANVFAQLVVFGLQHIWPDPDELDNERDELLL